MPIAADDLETINECLCVLEDTGEGAEEAWHGAITRTLDRLSRVEAERDEARREHDRLVASIRSYADWLATGPNTERVRAAIAERLLTIVRQGEPNV